MPLHTCADCGLVHDHTGEYQPPVNDDVRIAEINAHRDIEVAKLQARESREANETIVEVAEVQADAEVAAAEVTAEVVGELIAAEGEAELEQAGDGTPEVVIVDPPADPEPDVAPPPEGQHAEPAPAKKSMWPYG